MAEVEIPIVDGSTPVLRAIRRMEDAEVSAVIVADSGEEAVLTIGDLLDALWTRGNLDVAKIRPRMTLLAWVPDAPGPHVEEGGARLSMKDCSAAIVSRQSDRELWLNLGDAA